jgi:hypothetical protein
MRVGSFGNCCCWNGPGPGSMARLTTRCRAWPYPACPWWTFQRWQRVRAASHRSVFRWAFLGFVTAMSTEKPFAPLMLGSESDKRAESGPSLRFAPTSAERAKLHYDLARSVEIKTSVDAHRSEAHHHKFHTMRAFRKRIHGTGSSG